MRNYEHRYTVDIDKLSNKEIDRLYRFAIWYTALRESTNDFFLI